MSAIIRGICEKEYRTDALALWNSCFKEDAQGFSDFYYSKRSSCKNVLALFESGKMVSMLHIIPYPLILNGKKRDCRMVAGVATLHEYRNKGYAGALLTESNKLMREAGVFAAVLQPFDTAYYAKFGYKPLSDMKECICKAREAAKTDKLFVPDAGTLLSIYNGYRIRYNAMMARDEAYCALMLEEAKTDGGFILCNGQAYAKGWLSDDGALVCELAGVNESAMIAPLIECFGNLTVRIPTDVEIPCDEVKVRIFNMINVYSQSDNVNDDVKLNYSLEYY